MSAETPAHYEDHKVLLELELVIDELAEHEKHRIDVTALKGLGIDHQRMTLDRKDPASQPSFFASYPSIQEPSNEIIDELRSTLAFEDTYFWSPISTVKHASYSGISARR
ncbi:hypothetical protein N7457_001881 [Penicillium paradoxum]|uniref:uncharacterized protein n=1 Tax=Penicillium paradoxum TaxID=176176 RepID=UPI002546698B|nr:uncharacterized protein N7457_001881 [Penicillium paradoxum]KAJ5795282.1 hypothetical protein N7457_001881 [Penicillium paradoxum]